MKFISISVFLLLIPVGVFSAGVTLEIPCPNKNNWDLFINYSHTNQNNETFTLEFFEVECRHILFIDAGKFQLQVDGLDAINSKDIESTDVKQSIEDILDQIDIEAKI